MKSDRWLLQFLVTVVVGYLTAKLELFFGTINLSGFLINNLITILVALLAINSATLSIVLTKIREIIDKNNMSNDAFAKSKSEMMFSLKEQVALIIFSIPLIVLYKSKFIVLFNLSIVLNTCLISIFIFSIFILYDTAKSVFVVLEFKA